MEYTEKKPQIEKAVLVTYIYVERINTACITKIWL